MSENQPLKIKPDTSPPITDSLEIDSKTRVEEALNEMMQRLRDLPAEELAKQFGSGRLR